MDQVQTYDQRNYPWSGLGLTLLLRLGRPVQGVALHLRIAQQVEGLLILDSDPPLPILVDIDPREERLVTQPAVQVIAPPIDVRNVRQQAQRILQVLPSFQVLVVVRGDGVVNRLQGSADPGLLTLEHIQGHRVRIMSLQQLEALVLQLAALLGELLKLLGLRSHEPIELGMQHPCHILAHLRGDLNRLVVVLDQMLHILDQHGLPGAVRAAGMPARAHEIRVDPTLMVPRMADDQP
ncbi:MAG: hypothetical protein LKI30_01645 [Bifidobacterium crudilactis]|nr:hypothetical protein [Bifidobacterium crudilactis]